MIVIAHSNPILATIELFWFKLAKNDFDPLFKKGLWLK